jgi:hypothetical protein
MLRVVLDDRALAAEALACLDAALRSGQLDPEGRELQVLALPSGGRLVIGWSGRCALAALHRPQETPLNDGAEAEAVVAEFQSLQSGRCNLAALMIRLLALQVGAGTMTE